jgi:hypothetical protein
VPEQLGRLLGPVLGPNDRDAVTVMRRKDCILQAQPPEHACVTRAAVICRGWSWALPLTSRPSCSFTFGDVSVDVARGVPSAGTRRSRRIRPAGPTRTGPTGPPRRPARGVPHPCPRRRQLERGLVSFADRLLAEGSGITRSTR